MVAITSGSTPCRIIGSTIHFLKRRPRTTTDTTPPTATAGQNGSPKWPIAISTKNAGSMTNSPWAKLIVCEVCQRSVKPTATSA